jgi:hypothetical protein
MLKLMSNISMIDETFPWSYFQDLEVRKSVEVARNVLQTLLHLGGRDAFFLELKKKYL